MAGTYIYFENPLLFLFCAIKDRALELSDDILFLNWGRLHSGNSKKIVGMSFKCYYTEDQHNLYGGT